MRKDLLVLILTFVIGTLILLPNFYRNNWSAVDQAYYTEWQTRYDRMVVARLVKTRQDGFFSAGGLMGLGDTQEWNFNSATNRHQFNTYFNNGEFQSYLVYKSNPGMQGIIYSLFDQATPIREEQKLKLLRGATALLSAMIFGLILSAFTLEFGLLSGLLTLVFTTFSMWIILPAGSIFWNLWGFYLPFVASGYLLAEAARKNEYNSRRIHTVLFIAVLMKAVFSGFDLTTTVLIMATVPFVFHAIRHNWDRRTFVVRFVKAGSALMLGTVTGLIILSIQHIANEGSFRNAYEYILNRFTSHLGGDYQYFSTELPVRKIGVFEVLPKYLLMPAIELDVRNATIQILYWHLSVVFALVTIVFILKYRTRSEWQEVPRKALALLVATWYSLLAPLSWYVLFRPHSYIHTHVNTMGWQMPFTLLGFAWCGYVITDLLTGRQKATVNAPLSPSSQTD